MAGLSVVDWSLLVVAATLVGFAKTAVGGVAAVSIALFASVLPARESTGALLPLLLVGDVLALRAYRQHAEWPRLLRLFPSVAVGVLVGVLFVARVDDTAMRRTIGVVLLALVAVHLWQRQFRPRERDSPVQHGRFMTLGFGLLAGFTTMVANAGGAVMSLYLLSAGLGMLSFLGTTAWFFFLVNAFKVPFSVQLDLITGPSLLIDAMLVPAVLAGAMLGRWCIARLDQARFERIVLVVTVAASVNLVR